MTGITRGDILSHFSLSAQNRCVYEYVTVASQQWGMLFFNVEIGPITYTTSGVLKGEKDTL